MPVFLGGGDRREFHVVQIRFGESDCSGRIIVWSEVVSRYGWVVVVEKDPSVPVFPQERVLLSSSASLAPPERSGPRSRCERVPPKSCGRCTRTNLPPVRSASLSISSCGKARKRIEPLPLPPQTTRFSACSQALRFSVLFCAQIRM